MRIRGVFGRVEKRFPGTEKFTRKESRKVFEPEKFSGLLRNTRLASDTWVEFVVGSRPCSANVSPGSPVFLPPKIPTLHIRISLYQIS